jgi:hypothetical protein
MNEQSMTTQADEKSTDAKRNQAQKRAPLPEAVTHAEIAVSNPSGIGPAVCSLDGTSMVAFGIVSPASCVPGMTAVILDSNGTQVAVGTPVAPPGPPANWAFQFTGLPTGNPRPILTLVVTARNGQTTSQSSTNFQCGT